jgi:arginine N-succinyltransferase
VHRSTAPARKLLEGEGMHFEGYVDIFDAGPVLQARVSELRAMRDSTVVTADPLAVSTDTEPVLVSNTVLKDFRMIVTPANPVSGKIALTASELELLHCQSGDPIRTLSLNVRKNVHV